MYMLRSEMPKEDKEITILLAKKGFTLEEMSIIYELACKDCLKKLAYEANLNWGTRDTENENCVFCKLITLIGDSNA
jgi:hypothetical protein